MSKKITLTGLEVSHLLNALSAAIDDADFDNDEAKVVAYSALLEKVSR